MIKSGATSLLLGTILLFSLLINGVSIVAANTNEQSINTANVNASAIDIANSTQSFAWVLLLPLFFGCLLFLGWLCRYFEEMAECFIYFISVSPAIIAVLTFIAFYPDILKDIPKLLISVLLFIMSLVAIFYVRMNLVDKTKTKTQIIKKLIDRTRNF